MSNPYIGEIRPVGFTFAPPGWLQCDGQLVSISEYDALYALIGTTYGGDGVNTFGIPNLQSRIGIHAGTDTSGNAYTLGQSPGTETVALTSLTQIPSHNHLYFGSSGSPTTRSPGGAYLASNGAQPLYTSDTANPVALASNAIGSAGGGQGHNNIMPYQCLRFIIAVEGIYPSPS